MTDLQRIMRILKANKAELARRFGVVEIGVFGSFVRGEATPESDLDIVIEINRPMGIFKFIQMEDFLSGLLGVKVDLVMKRALKPHIGEQVVREVVYA